MAFKIFDKHEVAVALGAVRAVELSPSPDQDSLLASVACLHGVDLYPRVLPKPGAIRLDRVLRDARSRRRILELAVAFASSDGEIRPLAAANLKVLAGTLEHSDTDVRRLRDVASHYYLRARIDFTRRMAARVFSDPKPSEPEHGLREMLGRILRVRADPSLATRYHALRHLHPTSFGYAIWEHYRQNSFRFPGEGGGVPERLLFHDVAHVLSGYATDPIGELELAAFHTGCCRDDGFMPLYFGILQFHFGARATSGTRDEAASTDCSRITAAIARGASCRLDLTGEWDFWAMLPRALDDVRRELGVPPMASYEALRA